MPKCGISKLVNCYDRGHFATLLRRATASRSLEDGEQLHARIVEAGLGGDTLLGNLLVQMYGKCDRIENAWILFERIASRNVYSWNSILGALARAGELRFARVLLDRMPQRDVYSWTIILTALADRGEVNGAKEILDQMPESNAVAWTAILIACSEKGDLLQTRNLFEEMPQRDLASWNAMIACHSRNGELDLANQMFDTMPQWDQVSWNTIVTANAENGLLGKAQEIYSTMPDRDAVSCNCILQGLIENEEHENSKDFFDGMEIRSSVSWNLLLQAYIARVELDLDEFVGRIPVFDVYSCSSMIQAYGARGRADEAREMFDSAQRRDIFVWTSMALAYTQQNQLFRARCFVEQMPLKNSVSGTVLLVGYAHLGDLKEASLIFERIPEPDTQAWNAMLSANAVNGDHLQVEKLFSDMPERDIGSWNALMQAHLLKLNHHIAAEIFQRLPKRDVISWNTMIAAFADTGQSQGALQLFGEMDLEGIQPVAATFATVLNACSCDPTSAFPKARLIHEEILNLNNVDVHLWTSLVNVYGRAGCLDEAIDLFQRASTRDTPSWNAMLTAFARNKRFWDALHLFKIMDLEGVSCDERTYVIVLDACAGNASLSEGRLIHRCLLESLRDTSSLILRTALVNLYGSCGEIETAERIFNTIPNKDTAAWNSIITHTGTGNLDRAVHLFRTMDLEGHSPDEVTFRRVLEISSSLVDPEDVAAVEPGVFLTTALVNMYGRCGKLEEADKIFSSRVSSTPNVDCWNAMLAAAAHSGDSDRVVDLFAKMQLQGIEPDSVTFVILLATFSHSGKLREALESFLSMIGSFWLVPGVQHYVCMADLLARLGQVEGALAMVKCMPYEPMKGAWNTILGGCHSQGQVEQAWGAALEAIRMDPEVSSPYLLLSNTLTSS